jgi:hypothetical protein
MKGNIGPRNRRSISNLVMPWEMQTKTPAGHIHPPFDWYKIKSLTNPGVGKAEARQVSCAW